MPNLTTDSQEYYKEIKRLLTKDFSSEWTSLWNFCQMSQLLYFAQSFTFIMKGGLQDRKLIFREYVTNPSTDINNLGIYNLDGIKIQESEISVSLNDIYEIQELLKRDLDTIKYNGIVLDGLDCELIDFKNTRKLNWNLDSEMNHDLSLLIDKLRNLKNI